MNIMRIALLIAIGIAASMPVASAQDIVRDPAVTASAATDHPQAVDATAAMRAILRDPTMVYSSELAENAYDFNAPGSIPGFGPIDSATADRRLAQAPAK